MSRVTIEFIVQRLFEQTGVEWTLYVTFIPPGLSPQEREVPESEYNTIALDSNVFFKTPEFKDPPLELANRLSPQIWGTTNIFENFNDTYSVILYFRSLNIEHLHEQPI